MRPTAAALTLILAAIPEPSFGFVVPSSPTIKTASHHPVTSPASILSFSRDANDSTEKEDETCDAAASSPRHPRMETMESFGQLLAERMDTLGAAGFCESLNNDGSTSTSSTGLSSDKDARGLVPMQAGVVRTGIQIAIAYWIFRKVRKASYSICCLDVHASFEFRRHVVD